MTVKDMQDEIIRLKKERGALVLAHAYQSQDIWDVADYIGDSFGLSRKAATEKAEVVILCGVRFMAETVKILSPRKTVYLANPTAGCPMAEQIDRPLLEGLRKALPDHAVVAYINTTAELKAACDVCVTSSSAVKIIRALPAGKILFIPDCNLGSWVAKQVPGKDIELIRGGCPTHLRLSAHDVAEARRLHPLAKLLVHPECHPKITEMADFVGSTTEIMTHAETGEAEEYIIGTENSIVEHLRFKCPGKRFHALSKECICHNMKATTLADLRDCLLGRGGEEIRLPDEMIATARRPIDEMLRLG